MASGLSRVTIVAPRSRVDLALPSDVPLADLLPTAARLRRQPTSADDRGRPPRLDPVPARRRAPWTAQRTPAQLEVRDGELLYLRPARRRGAGAGLRRRRRRGAPPPPRAGGRSLDAGHHPPLRPHPRRRRPARRGRRACCSPARRSSLGGRHRARRRGGAAGVGGRCSPGRSATAAPASAFALVARCTPASVGCSSWPATGR